MPGVRAVLIDFHETLITADRWYILETAVFANEILKRLRVWNGVIPASAQERVRDAEARLRAISRETGIEYGAAEYARILLTAVNRGGQHAEPDVDAAVSDLFRSYVPDVVLKPGVRTGLDGLAALGFRMGVLSNARYGPFLHWSLEATGIGAHFEHIVVSSEVGLRKPRREIFDAGLAALRLPAAEVVYVGNDYLKDVVGAKLAGLKAVWVTSVGARDDRPYTRVLPDAVVERFDALPDLLASWRRESRR